MPVGQLCVTVDACRRLCAGCTDSGRIGRNTLGYRNCVSVWPAWRNTDERQHVGQTATSNKLIIIMIA